jgi:hypothetical protein
MPENQNMSCPESSISHCMLKPEFTVEEGTSLLNAIHIAIKAEGLDCAIVLVPIATKLKNSYRRMEAENSERAQRIAFAQFEAEKAKVGTQHE